jgi:hypothetical protein
MTRTFAALAFVIALGVGACGQDKAGEPASGEQAAGQEGGNVLLGSTQNMPDWLLVARQRDNNCPPGERCPPGEIHFNQRTISRQADGMADIWIQVRHPSPQLFGYEDETTRTTIEYRVERLHYRFNCNNGQFVVVERHIMGPQETVQARDEPIQIFRAPVEGSVTGVIQPIACRGH